MEKWISLFGAISFIIGSAIIFFVGTTPHQNNYDYPFYVISAARAMHGEKPYVDFAVVYGPGGYYIHGLGLKLLSFLPWIASFNVLNVIFAILYLGLIIWVVIKFIPALSIEFLLLVLYMAILMPIIAHYAYYSLMPTGFLLGAILIVGHLFPGRSPLHHQRFLLILLALIAVVATLVRINFGAYILFGLFILGSCAAINNRKKYGKGLIVLAVATTLLALLFAGLLYYTDILIPYVRDMIAFLPRYKVRHTPLVSSPKLWILTATLFLFALAILDLARRKCWGAGLFGFLILICTFHYSLQRFDLEHIYPLLLLFPLVYVMVARDYRMQGSAPQASDLNGLRARWLTNGTWAKILIPAAMFLMAYACRSESDYYRGQATIYWVQNIRHGHSFIKDGVVVDPEEIQMLQELAGESSDEAKIFWGSLPGCCESVNQTGANILLYLQQQQLPTTKIWYFDPCSTAYADVQQVLVDDLEAKKIKRIAMQGIFPPEIDRSENSSESRIFYNYVLNKYTYVKRYSFPRLNRYYDIYIRNEKP